MKRIQKEDKLSTAQFASSWCKEKIDEYNAQSIYLPAGATPIELFKLWEASSPDYLKGKKLIQIDDVISGKKKGIFEQFFHENLPGHISQFLWIKDKKKTQADMAILGLGLNGHIAFHEPGLPDHFDFGEVQLSEKTKYTLELEEQDKGFSYGLGAFLKCKSILMIVTGSAKRDILKKLINGDKDIPASKLLNHKYFTLVFDREANPED